MKKDITKLLSETFFYGLGSISSTIISFFLTPVLTRYLSVEGYGRLSILNVAVVLATNIFGLGLSTALFNNMLHAETASDRQKTQGTTWMLLLASSTVFFVCGNVFYRAFEGYLNSYASHYLYMLFLLTVIASNLMTIFYSILRALNKVKQYLTLSLISGVFTLALTTLFVAGLKRNIDGVFESRIIFTLLTIFSGFYFVRGFFIRRFDPAEARRLLSFGIYLVPTGILSWVLELSDRFLIQYYMTSKDVGIYTLGYQYATFLTYPMVAFQMAWPQALVEYAKEKDGNMKVGNIFATYLAAVYCAVLTIILFAPEGIHILGGIAFRDSLTVVFPVALGYIFFALYLWGVTGTYLTKDTRKLPYITLAGCVVNVAWNVLFLQRYGYMASAYATLVTFATTAALMWLTVYKVYPISLPRRKIFFHLLIFLILLQAMRQFQQPPFSVKCAMVVFMGCCFWISEEVLKKRT